MISLREISVLWSLFHILVLFMLLYRSRYPRKKTFLLTGLTMGPLAVLNVAGMAVYGTEVMGKAFILTCVLPSFFFFWFMSKDKRGKFFFTFCLADTVAYWILVVTQILDYDLGGDRCILLFAGRLLLFPLVEWVTVRYLRKPYQELQESVAGGWGIFAGMTALYYLLLVVAANFPNNVAKRPQYLPSFVLILLLMPMTYATILIALYRQLLLYRKRQSELLLQKQKNMLEEQLYSQQQLRKMKHNMKGYSMTLSGLLVAGRIEEAQAYLKGVEKEMSALPKQFCANPYLNAVLTQYAGKLEKLGADYSVKIQTGEESLPYMELCQILSNGLENACDALAELDAEKRQVSVLMRYNRNYLLMQIKNPCREDLYVESGTLPVTDKEGHDHGFGLSTVREAAAQLDGEMWCYTKEGSFILDVMLPCHVFSGGGVMDM